MSWKWDRLCRRTFETSTNGQQITEWRWTLRRLRVYWYAASLNIHHLPRTELSIKYSIQYQVIENSSSTILLGIYLDSTLTWNEHVEKTRKKICKRRGLLKRSKRFLTSHARVNKCSTMLLCSLWWITVPGYGVTALLVIPIPCSLFRRTPPE